MIHPDNIKQAYFVGIGGIGMSALARYFKMKGVNVAGYDKTPSVITDALICEDIEVLFSQEEQIIPNAFRQKESTLVVYTPAVQISHPQLQYFIEEDFSVLKRAQVLGLITYDSNAVCVAGTHGKTTISTMTAHLFNESKQGCTAFLGGISNNFGTNYISNPNSNFVVLEADEFDRSFLRLTPTSALVSSVDADHLDIYGDKESLQQAFLDFAARININGSLLVKAGLPVKWKVANDVKIYTYSANQKADFYANNIVFDGVNYSFDLITPDGKVQGLKMGIPGLLNVENAVGACALALLNNVTASEIIEALPRFNGIARRFEIHINTGDFVFIDDYAHHPEEIRATLLSVKAMYPKHKISGVFQPHLFSRTNDFAVGFADALSLLDELFLLDIYPARESPMPGVNSMLIGNMINNIPVHYCSKEDLPGRIKLDTPQVLITMGAGDIDRVVPILKKNMELLINM